MGTFYTPLKIENHRDRSRSVRVAKALVDMGSEYTWIPMKRLQQIGVTREKKDLQLTAEFASRRSVWPHLFEGVASLRAYEFPEET